MASLSNGAEKLVRHRYGHRDTLLLARTAAASLALYGIVMPVLSAAFLSDAEHRDLLAQAGFSETGRRPASHIYRVLPFVARRAGA